jgi:hypothetical protein
MNTPNNTEQLLLHALTELYNSFKHGDNLEANKAKTAVIKKCPDVQDALNNARLAIELATESKQLKRLNVHPTKVWGFLYPLYAKEFLTGVNSYEELANLIGADFDLTDKQWEAVLNEWEFKDDLLS